MIVCRIMECVTPRCLTNVKSKSMSGMIVSRNIGGNLGAVFVYFVLVLASR